MVIIPAILAGRAKLVTRSNGIVAGMPAVELTLGAVNPDLHLQKHVIEGASVDAGTILASVSGLVNTILYTERIALNFLQHLSGIATLTRRYVDAVAGLPAKILDTPKTTPAGRLVSKYAVR